MRDVFFGDVPAWLFMTSLGDVPLVRQTTAKLTRAIRGSPGMDPEVLVAMAEGMQRVEE